MARFFSRSTNQQAAPQAAPNAQQAQQDPRTHYRSLRRSPDGVENTKQTTSDLLLNLAQSQNSREQKFATDVVRYLLDFKAAEYANQRTNESAALNQLRQTIGRKPNTVQVTYDECLQLVKNRSSVFKRKLPDTIRNLTSQLLSLHLPPPGIVTERNRTFLDRCELRATPVAARQEILRNLTSLFVIYKNQIQLKTTAFVWTYPQILDDAVGDIRRNGGATGSSGDNERFMCEQAMHIGAYTDLRPPLQVAAEHIRTMLTISARVVALTPDNISLRNKTFQREYLEATANREFPLSNRPDLSHDLSSSHKLQRTLVPNRAESRKWGTLKESWKQVTEQYLRSKQLWRSDDALPNIFNDPAKARAALAACAVVYQKNVVRVIGELGDVQLGKRYELTVVLEKYSADCRSDLSYAINNLLNYQLTITFKGLSPFTFNDSTRRMWTRGLYHITSPLLAGERIWVEEMVPHDFQFMRDKMWIHSAPAFATFSVLEGNAPDVGWGERFFFPSPEPGQ